MNKVIQWLLDGPGWVAYRTRLDLLKQDEHDPQVLEARQLMLADENISTMITALQAWSGEPLRNHKSAGHPIHLLSFLAELGVRQDDPGMGQVISRIFDHISPEGPFQVLVNIPERFGGSGEDSWSWMLCDAPLTIYALQQFGLDEDERTLNALNYLNGLIREVGFPCAATPDLGRFRGPGRRDDPCPYANLLMLKALAVNRRLRDGYYSRTAAESLLKLWEHSRERHPYMFYTGTDFRKLKAPFIWYDILHVLDVLSRFPWLQDDLRLRQMAHDVRLKADVDGFYTPESVWRAWSNWDFGQKKEPSRWLTLLVMRCLKRLDIAAYG